MVNIFKVDREFWFFGNQVRHPEEYFFRYKWIFLLPIFFIVLQGDIIKLQTCKMIRAIFVPFFNSRKIKFLSAVALRRPLKCLTLYYHLVLVLLPVLFFLKYRIITTRIVNIPLSTRSCLPINMHTADSTLNYLTYFPVYISCKQFTVCLKQILQKWYTNVRTTRRAKMIVLWFVVKTTQTFNDTFSEIFRDFYYNMWMNKLIKLSFPFLPFAKGIPFWWK